MGGLKLQKRLAAEIMKVGISRVVFDNEHLEEIKNSITRADIRKMISHGYITIKPTKMKFPEHKKKEKRGEGSRKGKFGARYNKKRLWINTVRPLRKMLKELKEEKKIDTATYRRIYKLVKAGTFRSRAHLKLYLSQRGIKI